jgi:hypothetical protein
MKYKALVGMMVVAGLSMAAWAGDIEGKVTGMKGKSVVYVDTIPGKTFPAPKDHPLIDQKGLMFSPHIVVIQQGTTVDFQNSDNVAHNVFWTAVGNDKKVATTSEPGRKVRSVRSPSTNRARCRCSATFTPKWRAT